jgi:hypothetical protein
VVCAFGTVHQITELSSETHLIYLLEKKSSFSKKDKADKLTKIGIVTRIVIKVSIGIYTQPQPSLSNAGRLEDGTKQ